MPYHIKEENGEFKVVGPSGVHGTHSSRVKAEAQIAAIYANTGGEGKPKRRKRKPGREKR
jgi:hypothetical protein